MTPEGKVKAKVKRVLSRYADFIYGFWPVPSGYGESSLDYVGCCCGRFFAIETKAPGKEPTNRQKMVANMMIRAGGDVFVTDGDTTELEEWLERVTCAGKPEA
jgi:hypothetical protein